MAIKDILGSVSPLYGLVANKGLFSRGNISPLYGAVSGEGVFGDLLNPGKAAKRVSKEDEDEDKRKKTLAKIRERRAATKPTGLAKGGKVKSSASKRGDGVAQRGKTKGRMI